MIPFSQIAVGDYFEYEGSTWLKVPAEGLWNARCGDWWGQFEDGELVGNSYYVPPRGFHEA